MSNLFSFSDQKPADSQKGKLKFSSSEWKMGERSRTGNDGDDHRSLGVLRTISISLTLEDLTNTGGVR